MHLCPFIVYKIAEFVTYIIFTIPKAELNSLGWVCSQSIFLGLGAWMSELIKRFRFLGYVFGSCSVWRGIFHLRPMLLLQDTIGLISKSPKLNIFKRNVKVWLLFYLSFNSFTTYGNQCNLRTKNVCFRSNVVFCWSVPKNCDRCWKKWSDQNLLKVFFHT